MRYLISIRSPMRMVRTAICTSHIILTSIELVDVGGYMGMTVLCFSGSRIVSDLSAYFVGCCTLGPSKGSEAGCRSNGRPTSFHRNSRKARHCQP